MSGRAEVNARLKRTNIKGRDYIDVAQRVQAFWELYPKGRIETEMLSDDGKRCVFAARAYDMSEGGSGLLATGHAYEVNSGRGVNATSYVENCETSAVGRALGMLGIGSTDSIASADEVEAAQSRQQPQQQRQRQQQDPLAAAKSRLWRAVQGYAERRGCDPEAVLDGVWKRPDATPENRASAEWMGAVADELEAA